MKNNNKIFYLMGEKMRIHSSSFEPKNNNNYLEIEPDAYNRRSDTRSSNKKTLDGIIMIARPGKVVNLRSAIENICNRFESRGKENPRPFFNMKRYELRTLFIKWLGDQEGDNLVFFINFLYNLVGTDFFVAPSKEEGDVTDLFDNDKFKICISLSAEAPQELVLQWCFPMSKKNSDSLGIKFKKDHRNKSISNAKDLVERQRMMEETQLLTVSTFLYVNADAIDMDPEIQKLTEVSNHLRKVVLTVLAIQNNIIQNWVGHSSLDNPPITTESFHQACKE